MKNVNSSQKFPVVKRPQGTVIQSQKGREYVYITTEKIYKKDKKYNTNKRVLIGRMVDGENMRVNSNYYDFFPEQRELLDLPMYCDVLKAGAFLVFDKILKDSKLGSLIDEVYGEASDKIKDICFYFIINETSVMEHYESYAFDHVGYTSKIYSDSTLGKLLQNLSIVEHDQLLEKWNLIHTETEDILISYDSTNMNSASTGAKLLEYGKSKDSDSKLPQVNVGIGFNQADETPLFYETYYGSIVDNAQCQMMVDKVSRYGYKKISFLIDRGYFSLENIKYFEKKKYKYIIMALGDTKFVKPALDEVRYIVKGSKYYIKEHGVCGTTVEVPFSEKDKKSRYMHVYYDDVRGSMKRRAIMERFVKMDAKLEELSAKKITRKANLKQYEKYYNLAYYDEYLYSYTRKEETIQALIDSCGYFVIVTSEKMEAKEALDIYRHRDTSEKLFMYDKTFLEADTIRVHSDASIESKQMINFISLIIRNAIHKAMKGYRKNGDRNHTIPYVIKELEKIIMTKGSDGKYRQRYKITKTQRDILKEFGLSEKDTIKELERISERIYKNQNKGNI